MTRDAFDRHQRLLAETIATAPRPRVEPVAPQAAPVEPPPSRDCPTCAARAELLAVLAGRAT